MVGSLQQLEKVDVGKSELDYVETDPTGRYGRFKDVLGKGATKTVYKALDEKEGIEVAWNQVKLHGVFESPERLERLYSEVQLLRILDHDSVIQFYAYWLDTKKRTFNFITEMFTSGTLREYRRRHKRLGIQAIKSWARQILLGLVYLHEHDPPVIHRDLKCDNIFVNGHLGQVKIGDFGLATMIRHLQPAHSVLGTPEFMAPELYEEEYNELVDVYSFGMCLLEMLTAELPYSECSNPAQIYKKVTSGKLPEAFFRIKDLEARRFVGKCLENVSTRVSAKVLLRDSFLQLDENGSSAPMECVGRTVRAIDESKSADHDQNGTNSDMRIIGKLDSEVDTISLKVQITDKNGNVRNIFFSFDIHVDTAMEVATEMVKELDITDREPWEIAAMIDGEILALVPHWNEAPQSGSQQSFSLGDDDESGDGPSKSFTPSSPSPSSPTSSLSMVPSFSALYLSIDHMVDDRDGPQDCVQRRSTFEGYLCADDETKSQIAYCHSILHCNSGNELDLEVFPTQEAIPTPRSPKLSRFRPPDQEQVMIKAGPHVGSSDNVHSTPGRSPCGRRSLAGRCLSRIRSFVDVRGQIVHRNLIGEVAKRRLFKTVGAVECIGYKEPCKGPGKRANGSPSGPRGCVKQ